MNDQGGRPRQGPGGAVGVLHVVGGNDRGKQYHLTNPTTQIGRGADQDFVLADIAVSRRHVQVIVEGNRYRLRDLGSGNGTLINGVRTATALLNDGDQIEVGNTLLRFDHPPSSARTAAPPPPVAGTVPQAGAEARTLMAEAPVAVPVPAAAPVYSQPAFPQETPSDAIQAPPRRPPLPTPVLTDTAALPRGLLDTPLKKALFGALAVAVVLGGGLLARNALSGGGKEQADKAYIDATRAFSSGDYDGAKKLFAAALQLDPTNKLIPKQLKQCDVEIHAKNALRQAAALGGDKRWEEELKVLESVDKSSVAFEEAEKLRKVALPQAVAAWLGEAKEALTSDPDTARQRIEAAMALDPDNADAKQLADKLKGGDVAPAPVTSAGKADKGHGRHDETAHGSKAATHVAAAAPAPAPAPAAAPAAAPASAPKPQKPTAHDEGEGGGAAGDLMANKAASGPYRARDFKGAAQALRVQAKGLKGAAAQKTLALAMQVDKLADAYAKAEADKSRNAGAAVTAYQQAMGLDAAIGKGTHAAYFKAQAGKLAKDAARQFFQQQSFDKAFEMSKLALRSGDDGGVGAQLKAKAAQLCNQAASMVRSNPNGAKTLWRQVLRMVPPGDPSYTKAQQGLSASAGAKKDEDEDD